MMTTDSFKLGKAHKLCGTIAIDKLFIRDADEGVRSTLAYPLRAVWRVNGRRTHGAPLQFVISVPKRRLRHAVDRVQMRRRIREAYRLNHHPCSALAEGQHIDLALVYVADSLKPYSDIERAVCKILERVGRSLTES